MGTGLLAPFYRAGLMPQWLARPAERMSRRLSRKPDDRELETTDELTTTGGLAIKDRGGVICPTTHLSDEQRSLVAMAYAYRARAECALDVVSIYPGGDYLE